MEQWLTRGLVRSICLGVLLIPFVFYQLLGDGQLPDRPVAFDVGIATVSTALGGLLLNAGVNLRGPKRKETIQVAQKFLAVVILTVISIPIMHFLDAINVDISSFEPDSLEAWFRGFYFWLAAISFYVAIILFIIALADLAYALRGMDGTEHECGKNDAPPMPENST